MPGMRTSISTMSGSSSEVSRSASCAVARLAHDDHVVLRLEHHAEPHPQERLIVDEEDARRHAMSAAGSSERRACTRQPPSARGPGLDGAGVHRGALAHAFEAAPAGLAGPRRGWTRCP